MIEGVDVRNRIYANEAVPIEDGAVEELRSLLDVQKTAVQMYDINSDAFSCKPEVFCVN
jgi:hypothetical protein